MKDVKYMRNIACLSNPQFLGLLCYGYYQVHSRSLPSKTSDFCFDFSALCAFEVGRVK
jgi:hypothetical protein